MGSVAFNNSQESSTICQSRSMHAYSGTKPLCRECRKVLWETPLAVSVTFTGPSEVCNSTKWTKCATYDTLGEYRSDVDGTDYSQHAQMTANRREQYAKCCYCLKALNCSIDIVQ